MEGKISRILVQYIPIHLSQLNERVQGATVNPRGGTKLTCVFAGGVFSKLGVSEVELVTETDRAFFLVPSPFTWATGVEAAAVLPPDDELTSVSSFGMLAILVRKSFSRVWAITTMSSPALL